MLQRFLDPATLASIDGLDLIAKTVVDGFVAGLHRSPVTRVNSCDDAHDRDRPPLTTSGSGSPLAMAAAVVMI